MPQEWRRRSDVFPGWSWLLSVNQRDEEIKLPVLLETTRTNGSDIGEPVRRRKGRLAGRGKHDAWLGCVVQVKKRGGWNPPFWAQTQNFLELWWSKIGRGEEPKAEDEKKHIADRAYNTGHAWYKKGNFKMAMSEDHATCWVHKDLTASKGKKQALVTAAWASGGKDECHRQVWQLSSRNIGWSQKLAD